eukprot:6204682-Pleurochrysis_carterae.AAC.2
MAAQSSTEAGNIFGGKANYARAQQGKVVHGPTRAADIGRATVELIARPPPVAWAKLDAADGQRYLWGPSIAVRAEGWRRWRVLY